MKKKYLTNCQTYIMIFIVIISMVIMMSAKVVAEVTPTKNIVTEEDDNYIRSGRVYRVGEKWRNKPDFYFKGLPAGFNRNRIPYLNNYSFQGPDYGDPKLVLREDYLFCIAADVGLGGGIYQGSIFRPTNKLGKDLLYFDSSGDVVDVDTGEKTGENLFEDEILPSSTLQDRSAQAGISKLEEFYTEIKWLVDNFNYGQKYLDGLEVYQQAVATQVAIWRHTNPEREDIQYLTDNVDYIGELYNASETEKNDTTEGFKEAKEILENLDVKLKEDITTPNPKFVKDSPSMEAEFIFQSTLTEKGFPKALGDFDRNTDFEFDYDKTVILMNGEEIDKANSGIRIDPIIDNRTDPKLGIYGVTVKFPLTWFEHLPPSAEIKIEFPWLAKINAHSSRALILYQQGNNQPLINNIGKNLKTEGKVVWEYKTDPAPIDRTLVFKKYDIDQESQGLSGAEFELYKKNSSGSWVSTGKSYTTTNGNFVLRESDFEELGTGTYRFEETKAPTGYELPANPRTDEFEVHEDYVEPDTIKKGNSKQNKAGSNLSLKKIDADTGNNLPGAEFVLQEWKRVDGEPEPKWITNNKYKATTNSNGGFNISQQELIEMYTDLLGPDYEGLPDLYLRYREIKAPSGYLQPPELGTDDDKWSTEWFTLGGDGNDNLRVKPDTLVMSNKRIFNHQISLSKKAEFGNENNVSLEGIVFVLQANTGFGDWSRYGNQTFTTDQHGEIVVNNTVENGRYDGLIQEMVEDSRYEHFRFREVSVPSGLGFVDPKYPPNGIESYNSGKEFSIDIPIEQLREADSDLIIEPLVLVNKLKRYDVILYKKDSINKEVLDGAEFTIFQVDDKDKIIPEIEEKTNKGFRGKFEFDDLVIGRKYMIKETKAPPGYGLQSYEYYIMLDLDDNITVVRKDGSGNSSNDVILSQGNDYQWDGYNLELDIDVENTAMPQMPMTGGLGITIYGAIGALLMGSGYVLYRYIENKNKRSEL